MTMKSFLNKYGKPNNLNGSCKATFVTDHIRLTRGKRAVTCDFQQCGILTRVVSNEPVQPHFTLRKSKVCSVSSLTLIEYSSD